MFDDALVESRKTHSLGGKRLSLPVALGLHAAVIGAFVGASVWFTEGPSTPEAPVIICDLPRGAPSPPKGGSETHRDPPARVVQKTQPRIVSPTDIVASNERTDEPTPDPKGDADSTAPLGPGQPDGVSGSTSPLDGERIGTGSERRGGEEEVLPIGGDVRAPVLLARVEPDFPESVRRAHIDGMVILEAVITTSGDVQQIHVLRSVNPLLDEAAVRAVRAWRYRPATLNGRAVPVYLTVTVRFGIER